MGVAKEDYESKNGPFGSGEVKIPGKELPRRCFLLDVGGERMRVEESQGDVPYSVGANKEFRLFTSVFCPLSSVFCFLTPDS
ncbi:MAG: hypothetical protein CVU64_19665 [Deltaproteobacteria bacterium HGW-Deltaproteobacteria-21]|nr:MAG: hypothetical protein CVU64_19665 [Deltaproteobacteria bacterium HGW-Deltaproteobacteria-21]